MYEVTTDATVVTTEGSRPRQRVGSRKLAPFDVFFGADVLDELRSALSGPLTPCERPRMRRLSVELAALALDFPRPVDPGLSDRVACGEVVAVRTDRNHRSALRAFLDASEVEPVQLRRLQKLFTTSQ